MTDETQATNTIQGAASMASPDVAVTTPAVELTLAQKLVPVVGQNSLQVILNTVFAEAQKVMVAAKRDEHWTVEEVKALVTDLTSKL